MHEEKEQAGGLLAGDFETAPDRLGDPLDAVMAVAKERADAGKAEGVGRQPPEPQKDERVGVTVETKVKVGADESDADGFGEFDWPDGYVADPAALAKFVPLAKRLGLSKDKAQELAGLYVELDRERNRAQAEFLAKNDAEWIREVRTHPEFGGRNLQRTGDNVASLMRRYGSPLLTAQMRQMNIQNWPEMFYFLARVSQAMSEDYSPSGTPSSGSKTTAQLLFPDLK